jgi:flagellar protein FlaJ
MIFRKIAVLFSAIIPEKIVEEKVAKWLSYAGSKDDEHVWLGTRVFLATLVGTIFGLVPFSIIPLVNLIFETSIFIPLLILPLFMLGGFIVGFIITILAFYLHISYVIDGRKKMVENILPDFLYLVGNNLKSGMTPFYAFRSAVRPEFGPLSEEIQIAAKKSLGVGSFSDALKQVAKRIDSKVLTDTTKFFAHALKSGGRLAQLIETSAGDIKQTNQLKKELITSTRMYVIFIIFVVVIASPILLAVSVQFLFILGNIQEQSSFGGAGDAGAAVGFSGGGLGITPEFMVLTGYFLIIANSFLASIFIGVIGGGKIQEGLKLTPLILIGGLVAFNIILGIVGSLIGTMG